MNQCPLKGLRNSSAVLPVRSAVVAEMTSDMMVAGPLTSPAACPTRINRPMAQEPERPAPTIRVAVTSFALHIAENEMIETYYAKLGSTV